MLLGTNLSSKHPVRHETIASRGDPAVNPTAAVLEPDYCIAGRAGTRTTLNETPPLDDERVSQHGSRRNVESRSLIVPCDNDDLALGAAASPVPSLAEYPHGG